MKEKDFLASQQIGQQNVGTDYLQQAMQTVDSERAEALAAMEATLEADLLTLVAQRREGKGMDATLWEPHMLKEVKRTARVLLPVVMNGWDERKFVVGEKDAAGK